MNLTLSVDDQLVEDAREAARQQGTSLNALIREYLASLTGRQSGQSVVEQLEAAWDEESGYLRGWRFNREEIYEERLNRGGAGE